MKDTRAIKVTVNGRLYERDTETRLSLADFLRHEIGLTGTHVGCEHGVCGACTILIDGLSARSCLMLAVQASGKSVQTIEGLAEADGTLNVLQQSFQNKHGLQCGFCTPGMLMTLTEFLATNDTPTEADVRVAISGNICRCTGYHSIVEATLEAAQTLREAGR